MAKRQTIVHLSSALLILAACASTGKDWQRTSAIDSIEAYEMFLAKHGNSEQARLARDRIRQLDWAQAQRVNGIEEYRSFITKYPRTSVADSARQRLLELDWLSASSAKSREALERFRRSNPNSTFDIEAKAAIQRLDWEIAERDNTRTSYQAFLKSYPDSDRAMEARRLVKAIEDSIMSAAVVSTEVNKLRSRQAILQGVEMRMGSILDALGGRGGRMTQTVSSETRGPRPGQTFLALTVALKPSERLAIGNSAVYLELDNGQLIGAYTRTREISGDSIIVLWGSLSGRTLFAQPGEMSEFDFLWEVPTASLTGAVIHAFRRRVLIPK
jgi:outer membrane protein assembly factor BamD (BamD/ComL family)